MVGPTMNWQHFRNHREGLPDLHRPGVRQRCVGFELAQIEKWFSCRK